MSDGQLVLEREDFQMSVARERTRNRSEWNNETRTDAEPGRRTTVA